MKITRDTEYRRHLLDAQRARMGIGVRRTGVHVSDLIMCVRKAWAERVSEHVEQISDNTVLTWLRGLSHEALLTDGVEQVRAGYCFSCQQAHTYTPQIADTNCCPVCGDTLMVGTIDWVTLEGEDGKPIEDFVPVEMKSTLKSSRKTLEDGEMAWFVDQIKTYMAVHGRMKGRVAILHIMDDYSRGDVNIRSEGPTAELRVYCVEYNDEQEMADWLVTMHHRKDVVEGDVLPLLDSESPVHPFICDYCIIGERLPDGSQCDSFPWTREGVRKGTKLAQKMTMDEIAAELSAMSAAAEGGSDAQPVRSSVDDGTQDEACALCADDDEAISLGEAQDPQAPGGSPHPAGIAAWFSRLVARDTASLASPEPALVKPEVYRRDPEARAVFAAFVAATYGYVMTPDDWAFILREDVHNDSQRSGQRGEPATDISHAYRSGPDAFGDPRCPGCGDTGCDLCS